MNSAQNLKILRNLQYKRKFLVLITRKMQSNVRSKHPNENGKMVDGLKERGFGVSRVAGLTNLSPRVSGISFNITNLPDSRSHTVHVVI